LARFSALLQICHFRNRGKSLLLRHRVRRIARAEQKLGIQNSMTNRALLLTAVSAASLFAGHAAAADAAKMMAVVDEVIATGKSCKPDGHEHGSPG